MTVDIAEANRLLNEKYANEIGEVGKNEYLDAVPDKTPQLTIRPILNDSWHEAWKLEKQRADRLEQMLFKQLGLLVPEESEVKHTVSSVGQVNRTKANWPQVKRALESKFANFGNSTETKESA